MWGYQRWGKEHYTCYIEAARDYVVFLCLAPSAVGKRRERQLQRAAQMQQGLLPPESTHRPSLSPQGAQKAKRLVAQTSPLLLPSHLSHTTRTVDLRPCPSAKLQWFPPDQAVNISHWLHLYITYYTQVWRDFIYASNINEAIQKLFISQII